MPKPRTGRIWKRGRTWWVQYNRDGETFRESSHSEKQSDAEALLKRRLAEIFTGTFSGPQAGRVTMSELFDDVLLDYRVNGKALRFAEPIIKYHLRPFFGNMRALHVTTSTVKRYIAARQSGEGRVRGDKKAKGRKPAASASINRELSVLKRSFNLARRHTPPKILFAPYIPMLRENNVRKGFLDHENYVRLRQELPADLQALFVAAYHTGVRRGELLKITWPQVDFAAGEILLNPHETKNDEPRGVPIYGDMRPYLLMEKEVRDSMFPDSPSVFRRASGRPVSEFRKSWASACKRAGVPGLRFHDLRRSAVRNMELAGISRNVGMKISGHKTESVYKRYGIVCSRDLADAAKKLEQHFATSTKLAQPAGIADDRNASKLLQ